MRRYELTDEAWLRLEPLMALTDRPDRWWCGPPRHPQRHVLGAQQRDGSICKISLFRSDGLSGKGWFGVMMTNLMLDRLATLIMLFS